ncbi:DNA-directed RNA polymerase I subunit rpa49 [Xylographa carneopallida]|nr:DNA-directed RNA polymerase I subunit rpa49 [Xylographa carneopallida]
MSDRKRKRATENAGRSSKKLAPEGSTSPQSVKFSFVSGGGDWAPAIAVAPGLDLPTSVPLQAYKKPRITTGPRSTSTGRSTLSESELLLHCSAHPKLDYTAREESSGEADDLLRHYVGVYDPATGDIQIVPARKVTVRGTLRSTTIPEIRDESSEDEKAPPSRLAARTLLGEAFGTKKSQKAIRALTENAIVLRNSYQNSSGKSVLDPLASAVIDSMSQTSGAAPTREALQAVIDEAKPRPKANLEAETPADVYRIEDLVGAGSLPALKVRDWQTAVEANKDVQTSSKYVSRRLVTVVQSKNIMRLKALRYVLLLLDWYSCLKPGMKGIKKLPQREDIIKAVGGEITTSMLESLRKRFAPDGNMNKWAIDNFMTYVCALTLTIDLYEVDISDIRDDLRLETKQIVQYFQEIGCRVAKPTETEQKKLKLITKAESSTHKIAKLKLPLEFPKTRTIVPKNRR